MSLFDKRLHLAEEFLLGDGRHVVFDLDLDVRHFADAFEELHALWVVKPHAESQKVGLDDRSVDILFFEFFVNNVHQFFAGQLLAEL